MLTASLLADAKKVRWHNYVMSEFRHMSHSNHRESSELILKDMLHLIQLRCSWQNIMSQSTLTHFKWLSDVLIPLIDSQTKTVLVISCRFQHN